MDWIEELAREEAHWRRSPTMAVLERRGTGGGSIEQ
jgi:hypothetical protein